MIVLIGAVVLAAILVATIVAADKLSTWAYLRARQQRLAELERFVRDHLNAEAERLYPDGDGGRWPDLCADPPCQWEENYACASHQPRGSHHATPQHVPPHQYVKWDHCDRCFATFELTCNAPSYGPEPVVGHCEWAEDMTRRFAE